MRAIRNVNEEVSKPLTVEFLAQKHYCIQEVGLAHYLKDES